MNLGTTILKSRHSIRKYKPDPVTDLIIRDVLECGHLAPTAKNEQPWLFGVIKSAELRKKIADLTDKGKFIADAPLCIAVFGDKTAKYYLEDCCAATENLIIALQAYGIGSCWVTGEKKSMSRPSGRCSRYRTIIPSYLLSLPDTRLILPLNRRKNSMISPSRIRIQKNKLEFHLFSVFFNLTGHYRVSRRTACLFAGRFIRVAPDRPIDDDRISGMAAKDTLVSPGGTGGFSGWIHTVVPIFRGKIVSLPG